MGRAGRHIVGDVVDLVTPGVSVQPFGLTADQVFSYPLAIFSHESNLVAAFLTHVLTITDEGVDATQLRVWVGERIEVVNSSSQPHWIWSDPHPLHTDCPPLNQLEQL